MVSYTTLDVFTRFGTDAAGLERMLRMTQAVIQVLSSYTLPFTLLLSLLSWARSPTAPAPTSAATLLTLAELRARVALARRFFRIFRFLDAFQGAYALYAPPLVGSGAPQQRSTELWLDILGRSFNGCYLLLETLTLPDSLAVPGMAVWGPEMAPVMHVEAQRFWFFALLCGVGAGMLRLVRLYVHAPVPAVSEALVPTKAGEATVERQEKDLDEAERCRLQALCQERAQARQKQSVRVRKVLRRLVADALDLAVPGAVVGWVPLDSGAVGAVMLGSTWLTGQEVWERCEEEVARLKRAAAMA